MGWAGLAVLEQDFMIPPCRSFQHRLHLLGLISNYLNRISWIENDSSMSNSSARGTARVLEPRYKSVSFLSLTYVPYGSRRRVLAHRPTSIPLFVLRKEILIFGSLHSLIFTLPSHHSSSSLYSPAELTLQYI
jgi:hypothetical protein